MGELLYYLDHAAATPCDERVVSAMQPYMTEIFYNPSSSYAGGRRAKDALERAREDIASLLGAKAHDIIFTAGATESINLAIHGILYEGGHAVISGIEHPAVYEAVKSYPHTIAKVDKYGFVSTEEIEKAITDKTVLVSVALADSEFGTVQPVSDIARMIDKIRLERRKKGNKMPLYFHSDGSQGALALDLKVSRLGVDLLTLNGAKCYGPKQTGLLFMKSSVVLEPLFQGGGQERGLRGGTENVAGAVGLAAALTLAQKGRHAENNRLESMSASLVSLVKEGVEDIAVDRHPKKHLPGHVHFHVDGLDAERVVFNLDNKGIYIATGAACAANKSTRSKSLEAAGLTPSEADGSFRVTLGHLNNESDIPDIAKHLVEAIKTERKL